MNNQCNIKISVYEPQCWGIEHVPFNAALLESLSSAYQGCKLSFYGESSHIKLVEGELEKNDRIVNVRFKSAILPDRQADRWGRVFQEYLWLRAYQSNIQRDSKELIVFSSMTPTLNIMLKWYLRHKRTWPVIMVIFHGVISQVSKKIHEQRPWNALINVKYSLKFRSPTNYKTFVLSESIRDNLINRYGLQDICSIHHPYLWRASSSLPVKNDAKPWRIKFGLLGINNYALKCLIDINNYMIESETPFNIEVIGWIGANNNYRKEMKDLTITSVPLSRAQYEKMIENVDYIIWLSNPAHYKYSASGTFLDALTFLKPGIYLNNDYIKNYFHMMGDIGYLCESVVEIEETIKLLIAKPDINRYNQQRLNIYRGREIFSVREVGRQIRKKIHSNSFK